MPLYLINHYGKQELVELPNDKHIQGEILWCDEKHGPLPNYLIVGAMDVTITTGIEIGEDGREIEKEFDRVLIVNPDKKAQLDAEKIIEDAKKLELENKKKSKDDLLLKLKQGEHLNLTEINNLLRVIYDSKD